MHLIKLNLTEIQAVTGAWQPLSLTSVITAACTAGAIMSVGIRQQTLALFMLRTARTVSLLEILGGVSALAHNRIGLGVRAILVGVACRAAIDLSAGYNDNSSPNE